MIHIVTIGIQQGEGGRFLGRVVYFLQLVGVKGPEDRETDRRLHSQHSTETGKTCGKNPPEAENWPDLFRLMLDWGKGPLFML